MAKFRSNHASNGNSTKRKSSFVVKAVIYGLVLLFFLWKLLDYFKIYENFNINPTESPVNNPSNESIIIENFSVDKVIGLIDLPSQSVGNALISHKHFTLSYSEKDEQAEWVAYELTRAELNAPKVSRYDYFSPDNSVLTRSALHRDYTGSGYTRGHLAPAADMAFDQKAAEESFYMSNISPQEKYFNQGIWRELEENVRDWARKNYSLLIVTGPVLNQQIIKKIGDNKVAVPSLFYKVVLDTTGVEKKGIGFVIQNERSELPLEQYMVSIDSVEILTKINFYNASSKNATVEVIESIMDKTAWLINPDRYRRRIEEWNKN